jgi:HPt (histidine-containing phosphotransfer) domain-containing protein
VATQHPTFDAQTIPFDRQELAERCLGDADLLSKVLSRFEDGFQEDYQQMVTAAFDGDSQLVAQLAHRLKGSAANAAAKRICLVAGKIEQWGRARQLEDVPAALQELQNEWRLFVDYKSEQPEE